MVKGKNVLVAGGSGLIGRQLVRLLKDEGAHVKVADKKVSLDIASDESIEDIQRDLTTMNNCMEACHDMDYVFNLMCIKGSPKAMKERPASHLVPMLQFNTNLMEAARICKVSKYLYTSSVAVYEPKEMFSEDDVWVTFPSPNDRFAGWAKRMGELQAEAYQIQHKNSDNLYCIVRPGNVYGRYDNFDPLTGMVIPSLISRIFQGESPLKVWGNGKPIRDFVHASDVAKAMIFVMENNIDKPVNVSSGFPTEIKKVVEIITSHFEDAKFIFSDEGVSGDNKRLMDVSRLKSYGWQPEVELEDGIKDTIDWFKSEGFKGYSRYNSFREEN